MELVLLLSWIFGKMTHVVDMLFDGLIILPGAGDIVLDLFDILLKVLFFAGEDL